MNAFVRDGAVNRKRRVRPGSSIDRGIDPNRKKIRKTEYDDETTTQSDLRLNFGESTVNQSTSMAVETDKESRYSNADFIRAKAFLYLKFKKINPTNINKSLEEHLKRFDKDETQLKKIFEQCYDLTKGSVEMSEAMMKQLETNSCGVHLTNVSSRIRDRLFNNSCKEVVKKTVKRNNITKDKKLMPSSLKKRIDDKISILFGNFNSINDRKILYSNPIFHTVPENDISHDNTCRITKSYSIRTTQNDSIRKTKISKPNANCIVRENHISCINNPVNDVRKIKIPQLKIDGIVQNTENSVLEIVHNAKNLALETNIGTGEIVVPQLRIDETIQNTKELALEIVDDDDVGEIMSPRLIIDETVESIEEYVNNVKDSALEIASDGEEIMIPQIRIDETIQNSKELALEIVDDDNVGEIMSPRLIIDETVESIEESVLKISEEITVTQLNMDKCVNNVKDSALEIVSDGGEIMIPQLRNDEIIQNTKELALEIVDNDDVGEIMSPRLIIDETVESIEESVLKISEEITVTQLNMDKCVNNVKDSALEIVSDGGEIMIPQLRNDEIIQNTKELALEIVDNDDVGEIMSPRLIIDETVESIEESVLKISEEITVTQLNMDKCVNNVKDSALEIVSDGEEIMIPCIRIDDTIQNVKELALEIVDDDDVGEIMSPRLIMDGNIENTKSAAFQTNIDVINEIENTNDMNQQPEIFKHFINIVLKIGRLIDPEDEIFKNSIIKDLATYFLNDDFLSKVDILFNTTESDLVGELIVKLLDMFNDSQFNMAPFSGCLISVFREIALKSSIPPCRMKLKLIVFLDAIKKYIRVHDYGLYRSWFLPSMFFDWCFFVAYIFMNTNKDFIIDLNKKSIIKNATLYYNMVKQSKYVFINQDSKPKKTLKKSGIFELTRIDDLLEIDDVYTKKSDNQVVPNIFVNIPFKEPKHNKLKIKNENENCIETINLTTMAGDEEKECPTSINFNVYVNPKYNVSNSFLKPLDYWFGFDVTELRNQLNATISNKSNESSIVVQNNTTNVDNNIQPIDSNFGSEETSVKNKSRKRKKSTQVESPRVYFTVANNPKQFNLTFGSSVVTQSSNSSTDPQNTSLLTIPQTASQSRDPQNTSSSKVSPSSRSSTNPQNISCLAIPQSSRSSKAPRKSRSPKNLRKLSSSTISQNEGLLTIPQNPYSPTVSQNSSSLTFPQFRNSSTVPNNRSSYSNNNLTNTQYPETFQTVRQSPYSSTVPQNTSLLTKPQNPYSPTVHQNSCSSTMPQHSSSSAVSRNASLLTIPQNPYSPTVHQNSCSLTMPQHSSSSAVSHNASLLTIPQNPYSPTVHQNSSSLTFPQRSRSSAVPQRPRSSAVPQCPRSSAVPQCASLLTIPQNPYSPTVPQDASSLTIPQNPYSPTVHQNSSSLTFPQRSRSSAVPQRPRSSAVPQCPRSSAVPQCASLLTIPQNPYSPTVPQDASSLTIPQNPYSPTVPLNQSSYYNNILSNTQYPESLQTVIPQNPYPSTVPQNTSLLTIPQNPYSPTVHQNSSSLTIAQHSSSLAVPQHLSPYYNNFSSSHTQIPIGFRKDSSISNTTQTSKSKSTPLPVNNNLQSSITTLPPDFSNKWPQNLYHQSTTMNALCSMVANTCSSNALNTSNVNKNPYFGNSCRHYSHYTPYTGFIQTHIQSLYNENIPFTTSQHSNAPTCITNHVEPISRDVVGNTQTIEASINNAHIQQLNDKYNNINHGSSLVNQNNLQTPEYNSQVSPDLPDARLPNMPNLQNSDTRNKTCMAANCSNISCFCCETCMAAFYCSTQCQTTDLHYHKNECQRF